jgi:hypothetical protein
MRGTLVIFFMCLQYILGMWFAGAFAAFTIRIVMHGWSFGKQAAFVMGI